MNSPVQNLIIEKLTVQDISSIQLLQPDDWGNILPNTRFYLQSVDCFPIKAIYEDKIVGTGVVIINKNIAWLANIIVSKDFRNRGFGYKITQHLIEFAKDKCDTILLIATKLGKPIYEKLGFQAEEDYLFFNKGKLSYDISDKIFVYQPKYKQDILELDYMISGEKRYKIIEPYLESAFLFIENSKLTGFLITDLGEGLIMAKTPDAGISLLKLRLLEEKMTIIPSSNKAAIEFLLRNGISRYNDRIGVKMFLGKKISWKPECIYSRIGGNLG